MTGLRRGRPGGAGAGDRRGLIVAAATRLFAEHGFDAVSLRQIAREAGVDPALVHHYFSGKDQVYAASVELPADPDAVLAGLRALPAEERAEELLRAVAGLWEGPRRHAMAAFVRGSLGSRLRTAAMREVFRRRILPRVAEGLPGDDAERELRGSLAATQIAGFVLLRYLVQLEPLASMPLDEAIRLVAPAVQRHLTGPAPGAGTGSRSGPLAG
ncbi:TetR family transcriptional regulator [Sinomonas mesophila]|uniref:TetR/AcrR family transcriptional regulator n=1 Tax=Sinomonas mesophila TaxID=1531955 RepID=UPI001FEC2321|nr:TetR family transcriptional regulator [Sinomonas mesophila]